MMEQKEEDERGDVNKMPQRRRHNEIEKWRYTNARREDVPHRSLQAGTHRRERWNLTADSKAINHKAINVMSWDGYATVITYIRGIYTTPALECIPLVLCSAVSRRGSVVRETDQGCSDRDDKAILLESRRKLDTSPRDGYGSEYLQRHNDALGKKELAVSRMANRIGW